MIRYTDLSKKLLPLGACLLVILLAQTPTVFGICVPLVYVPIFYFAIFRPSVLNAYVLFGLGLFADCLNEAPFGLYAFLFVLLFFVARLNRLFLKDLSFKNLWMLFAFFSAVLLLTQLFFFFLCAGTTIPSGFLLREYIILNLCYPFGFALCGRVDARLGEV